MRNRPLFITVVMVLIFLISACSASRGQNNSSLVATGQAIATASAVVPNTGPVSPTSAATGVTNGQASGTPAATAGAPSAASGTATALATTAATAAATAAVSSATPQTMTTGTPAAAQVSPTSIIGIPQTGASSLIGLAAMFDFKVVDVNGNPIGAVQDYVVNACESNIVYIVVNPASGIGGNSGQQVLIPYQATLMTSNNGKVDVANHQFSIAVKASDLTNVPAFDYRSLDLQNPTWEASETSFWQSHARMSLTTGCLVPAGGSVSAATGTPVGTALPAGTLASTTSATAAAATGTPAPATSPTTAATAGATATAGAASAGALIVTGTPAPAGTATVQNTPAGATTATAVTTGTPQPTLNRVTVYRDALASQLLSASLVQGNGVPLGTVRDAAIDPQTGRLQYLIVQPGSASSSTNNLVALPLAAVTVRYQVGSGQPVIVLLVSTSVFQQAPAYDLTNKTVTPDWFGYWQKYVPMTKQQLH